MRVLLIAPEYPETFWSFKGALPFVGKKAALPPLGLLTVGAMLPADWELRLCDLNVERLTDRLLGWADLVLVGAMIAQRASAEVVIQRAHALGKKIVAGGPLFADAWSEFPLVDHFVLGEAELSLAPFLRDWAAGIARRVYRADGLCDVTTTPVPRWNLAKMKRYASWAIQYSRGCPFDCEFCDVTAKFGHRPRLKTAPQIVAELESLLQAGWRGSIFFVDDNLIGNKVRLKRELLPALIEWRQGKRGFPFYTEASINLADDPELMHLMSAAGFDTVFVGIETPSAESLVECQKKQNQGRNLVTDIQKIQQAGLQVQGGFIVGFDHDAPNIFQRQIDFIQESGVVTAMVGLLNALPGTRLHQRMEREGRLVQKSSGNNSDGTTNFRPVMDRELLENGYRRLVQTLYAVQPYYRRVRTFLQQYGRPQAKGKLDVTAVQALFKAVVRLGVVGPERIEFWRLLGWTLVRRPHHFRVAVTLAIYGHHFRRCAERLGLGQPTDDSFA